MKSKWLKVILIFAAILLGLTTWLHFSRAHSKNAVDRYKEQLLAAGEKLNVDDLLPPPVDPEKNGVKLFFQANPYLSYDGVIYTNPAPAMLMVAPGKAMIGWKQPEIIALYGFPPATNTWIDIEQELKQRAPGLDLLHQAAGRPELDFGLNYHDSSGAGLTHVTKMNRAASLLSCASVYDLNRGETASSVTNVHTLLTFVDEWKSERVLISQLVRIAMAAIAAGDQWEVLQATNLTDSQLAMLQRDWESMEFVRPMEHAMEIDRIWEVQFIENLRTSNSPSASMSIGAFPIVGGGGSGTSSSIFKDLVHTAARKTSDSLWRTSWSYGDELRVLQAYQDAIETLRQIEKNGFFKDALAEHDRKISALASTGASNNWLRVNLNDDLLDWFDNPNWSIGNPIKRMMGIEATRRIAITAIALKRYQLRHGIWPNKLSALVPEFISEVPRDPVDGLPLRYRANADGTFALYSIGSDGVDDGGDPSPAGTYKGFYWQKCRDWVWPQPATAEEIQNYYKNPPK